jgi:hypothetical protein
LEPARKSVREEFPVPAASCFPQACISFAPLFVFRRDPLCRMFLCYLDFAWEEKTGEFSALHALMEQI